MFLGAHHFHGDPAVLVPCYDSLRRGLPPQALLLHVCVTTPDGITVLDACPDRATFEEFSVGAAFLGAVADAGLPAPRTEPLGEVHDAVATGVPGSRG